MSTSDRVLIAGIGNVFFGDDGFGVAVARELARCALPPSVVVRDTGIRGLHLAYELVDGWDLLIAIDAVARGAPPGTLHVIEPTADIGSLGRAHDAHGMDLASVLDTARSLGAIPPAVLVVGCDVANVSEGIGLTPEVEAAVPQAVRLVISLFGARARLQTSAVVPTVIKEVSP
jgi:hydrogenase maturation protease